MIENQVMVYIIISTGVDADRGFFPNPSTRGSYLSLERAREELDRLITEEKDELDDRYDKEDRGENYWEMYQDGYAADLFSRLEILPSQLMDAPENPMQVKKPHTARLPDGSVATSFQITYRQDNGEKGYFYIMAENSMSAVVKFQMQTRYSEEDVLSVDVWDGVIRRPCI